MKYPFPTLSSNGRGPRCPRRAILPGKYVFKTQFGKFQAEINEAELNFPGFQKQKCLKEYTLRKVDGKDKFRPANAKMEFLYII
jgi:hypothetical protein